MLMQSKMSEEEFRGALKKFGLTPAEACNLLWMKTRAVVNANTVNLHVERYGAMSGAYTAAFRLLFKELERDHDYTA
jgi:hypothetical protein